MKNLINKNLLNTLMFLLLTLLLLSNCCEEITEPKPTEPDTTTQAFVFEEYSIGEENFSELYGAWIFDENNIWVVGWFHGLTNIIRWNGTNWYEVNEFQGTSSEIYDIWALDSNTVYFVTGGIYKYKNGTYTRQVITNLPPQGMILTDIWASSENNVWAVGEWGAIAHYDGVSWKKVEFDTQCFIMDITGNPSTGIAYAVAINLNLDYIIIELNNSTANIIYNSNDNNQLFYSNTIHFRDNLLYMAGGSIWCYDIESKQLKELTKLPIGLGIGSITSSSSNDIYYFGDESGEWRLVHYNGVRYKIFKLPHIEPIHYGGSHSIKDLAISVGLGWGKSSIKSYLIKIRRTQ